MQTQTTSQTYRIASSGREGVYHTVTILPDGRTDCTCEHSTYRRAFCKHQRLALVLWTDGGRSGALYQSAGGGQRAAEIIERNNAEFDRVQLDKIVRG